MKFLKLIGLYTCLLIGLCLLGRLVPPHLFLAMSVTSVLVTYALLWRSLSSAEIAQLPRSKWDTFMKATSWLLVGIMAFSLTYGMWMSRQLLSESLIALPVGIFMNLVWVYSGMFSILRRTNRTPARP